MVSISVFMNISPETCSFPVALVSLTEVHRDTTGTVQGVGS